MPPNKKAGSSSQEPAGWVEITVNYTGGASWLITAPGADHLEMLAIENDYIVAKKISEGDVVAAVQTEFFPRLSPDDLLEGFGWLISLFFRACHAMCLT